MAVWTTLSGYTTYVIDLISKYFDGSFVDVGSIAVALAFVYWHRSRIPCDVRCAFLSRETGRLLVNAISIFPLFLLAISFLSSKLTEALLSGSKITLTIAGCYALFTMVEDLLSTTNAAQQQQADLEMMGPPAPILAPQQRSAPISKSPILQSGKTLSPSISAEITQPLTRSQRRRRAHAAKKQQAAESTFASDRSRF